MVTRVQVPGHGIVEFPEGVSEEEQLTAIRKLTGPPVAGPPPVADTGEPIDDQIKEWQKYGRRGIEHPDVPTIARLPFGEVWGKDVPVSSSAALFGVLATENPDARQQIVLKHLPGAKGMTDKYGNPMIEHKGKPYYMARPGEFDATDAAKAGGAAIVSAPALAALPVSLPVAMGIGGLTAGGMSLAEDYTARAAGGTAQQYDPAKATIATALGTILPFGVAKVVLPVAGRINELVRRGVALSDEVIRSLGIDPSILTQGLRDTITAVARRSFGDRQATQSAYRQGLGQEFDTRMTRGEISQNAGQQSREKLLSGPGDAEAASVMQEFRTGPQLQGTLAGTGGQEADRTAAQNALRGQMGGGQVNTQAEATTALKRGYTAADTQAKNDTSVLYGVAQNPALLGSSGMPTSVPIPWVAQLGQTVRAALGEGGAGRATVHYPDLVPNTAKALADIEKWAAGESGMRGHGVTDLSWEEVNRMRQTLGLRRQDAFGPQGSEKDQQAIEALIRGFDEHFAGMNPMLRTAMASHADRMGRFNPGNEGQDRATTTVLKALKGDEEGATVAKSIFGEAKTGDALQMINHLQTQVFPNNPEMMNVVREQAIRRLTTDAETGATLSPRQTVTAMEKALDGDAERPLYAALFNGEGEMATLRRYLDLQRAIAAGRESPNPSKTGLLLAGLFKRGGAMATGGAIGGAIGNTVGHSAEGAMVGGGIGHAVGSVLPRMQAQRAVNPPANYAPLSGQSRATLPAGLLATPPARDAAIDELQQQGPADRLMKSLLMGGM